MWIKRILIFILLIVLLIFFGLWFYSSSIKTDYNEVSTLDGLQKDVTVYYDKYAIPHIYAKNTDDAYFTIGYVQAKERLFQIELIRRLAAGRLAEILGEAAIESDKFMRTIGITEYSKRTKADFEAIENPEIKSNVLAYIEGINTFIKEGYTPIEFTVLGIEKEEFSIEDVHNIMGYMAFSFAMAHRTEPILDYINHKFGTSYLNDLDVHVDTSVTLIKSNLIPTDNRDISIHTDKILKSLPFPQLIGSNSWIVGAEKSVTGDVLFANDPHIGFAQPAVWFEVHYETPTTEGYAYHLPGYPFPQLLHNRHHAIGLTMFENDDIDLYREKQNPANANQYWHKDEWKRFKNRAETIVVNDGEDIQLNVRETIHGPVINDIFQEVKEDNPISMYWVYTKFPNNILESAYLISNGKSVEEVAKGVSLIHAPGLNIMYGDVDGNIAWWTGAKLPKRAAHVNSKLILDGASGNDDITEYIDFEMMPHSINPSANYVYSANNQPLSPDESLYPGYYLPEDRARRITTLLESKDRWTTADFKEMLLDVTSENVPEISQSIVNVLKQTQLSDREETILTVLDNWVGDYSLDAIGPTIYTKLIHHIIHKTMADELGESFETFNGTHILERSIQPLLSNGSSEWWDDINSDNKETITDIFTDAFKTSISELTNQLGEDHNYWKWEKVHTITHDHVLGSVEALSDYFNVGPYEIAGAGEVINNLQFQFTDDGTYEVKGGPSTRRIVDFDDIENNSWSILPTGQSGNPLSPHYKDQAEMFVNGKFRKMMMNKNEIISTAKYVSEFSAKDK